MTDRTCLWPHMIFRNSTVSIRLEDPTIEGLTNKIAEYEKSWPSPGYGTYIDKPKYNAQLNLWVATGTRGSTCD
jgi:hypothetical protein